MGLVKYDNEQKKHLRENLKKFTEERGLAKTDLADKLGWSYNTVISWFKGSYFCILPKRRANSSRDFTRNCR